MIEGADRCEITDPRPSDLAMAVRVTMTFRRVWTAQGVHNYFWKARPLTGAGGSAEVRERGE